MATLNYSMASDRVTIGNVELHAGDLVTVVLKDGGRFETRVEKGPGGWYLVDFPKVGEEDYNIVGLEVDPL